MYATLYAFLRLSPADRAKVTRLDLSIASDEDLYRLEESYLAARGLGLGRPRQRDEEEYPGEVGFTYPEGQK